MKLGFTSSPQLSNNDEFGSAHECNISASKVRCECFQLLVDTNKFLGNEYDFYFFVDWGVFECDYFEKRRNKHASRYWS